MLVCHCRAVREAEVRAAIMAGALDAPAVGRACGAGTACGGCLPTVERLLDECLGCPLAARTAERVPASAVAAA